MKPAYTNYIGALILGTVGGLVFFLAVTNNNIVTSQLLKNITSLSKSEFSLAAIGSCVGALGATFIMHVINYKKEQAVTLSKINACCAKLVLTLDNFAKFKRDCTLPCDLKLKEVLEKLHPNYRGEGGNINVSDLLRSFMKTSIDLTSVTNDLALFCHIDSRALLLSAAINDQIIYLQNLIDSREEFLSIIKADRTPTEEKLGFYLGYFERDGVSDESFKNISEGLITTTDAILSNLGILIPKVQKIGQTVLEEPFSSRVIRYEIDKNMENLIPPPEFVNWGE